MCEVLVNNKKITATFINTTPQDILTYCLNKAEIIDINISTDNFTTKKLVVINNKSVIDILKLINVQWKINYKFYFSDGCFFWIKEKEENKKVYSFEYGTNIIKLEYQNGWILETVIVPFIKHSDTINIEHQKLSGNYKVKKIVHKYYKGYTRSYIYV